MGVGLGLLPNETEAVGDSDTDGVSENDGDGVLDELVSVPGLADGVSVVDWFLRDAGRT